MTKHTVLRTSNSSGHGCAVVVGERCATDGLQEIWQPSWQNVAIVGDATVLALHGQGVAEALKPLARRVLLLDFPPGEQHKSRRTKTLLEDRLLEARFDRLSCIVGLGGGISLDLAGFVAATFMRGLPHLNLPTSLLAQVDAAIGGKTGVNTPRGKNLVGAYHHPRGVLIDRDFLRTLPAERWPDGVAELVKHAVIGDATLLNWIEEHTTGLRAADEGALSDFPLLRSVQLKTAIVERDEREQGLRAILNFGHTIGHAIEAATGYEVSHGRAVAVGMRVESHVARAVCGLPSSDGLRLRACLDALELGMISSLPQSVTFDSLVPFLGLDKKRRGDQLRLALPRGIGVLPVDSDEATIAVELEVLRRAWEEELACSA